MTASLPNDAQLAELVASRLCHDFGSPLATLTSVLPQASEGPAQALLQETAMELRARHQLYNAVFGLPEDLEWDALPSLLRGSLSAHRVAFAFSAPTLPSSPASLRLVLAAALLASEALPRGGRVQVTAEAPGGFTIWPQGRDGAWSPTLISLLAGGSFEAALAEGPRRVLAPWLVRLAAPAGHRLDIALGAGAGGAAALPPLLLVPQG